MFTFRSIPIFSLAIAMVTSLHAEGLKVATIDMETVFIKYYRTTEAQKQIDTEKARVAQEGNERVTRIREISTKLENIQKQAKDPAVNDSKKQELAKEFGTLQQEGINLENEHREFVQRRNQALAEKMTQRKNSILDEISNVIAELSKQKGFDFVLDRSARSAQGVKTILYSKDAVDISSEIITLINKDAPKEEKAEAPKTQAK